MQISKETVNKVLKFRDDRDWKQFHDPKDLAISISLEASELLEIFQWSRDDVYCLDKIDKIKEELAQKMTEKLGYGPSSYYQIGAEIAANAGPRVVGIAFDAKE